MLGGRDRGQTNIDFIIAIAIFLIAFTFVLGFMPRLFAPYSDEEKPIVADRVQAALVNSILIQNDSQPGELDNDTVTNTTLSDLRSGIGDQYQLNVTIKENTSDGTTLHSWGPEIPQNRGTVATSQRTVLIDTQSAVLEVRVW